MVDFSTVLLNLRLLVFRERFLSKILEAYLLIRLSDALRFSLLGFKELLSLLVLVRLVFSLFRFPTLQPDSTFEILVSVILVISLVESKNYLLSLIESFKKVLLQLEAWLNVR